MVGTSIDFDSRENTQQKGKKVSQKKRIPRSPKMLTEEETHIYMVKNQSKKPFTIGNVPEETRECFLQMAKEKQVSSRELLSMLLIDAGADILDLRKLNPSRRSMKE